MAKRVYAPDARITVHQASNPTPVGSSRPDPKHRPECPNYHKPRGICCNWLDYCDCQCMCDLIKDVEKRVMAEVITSLITVVEG